MIVGIDLGTTNSLVSLWRDDTSVLIQNSLEQVITPSVVGLDDQGRIICGQAAKERLYTHPQLTTSVFKRYMGSQKEIKLGDKAFTPQELSSFVLKSLKADAEAFLGESITEAIITVPAYFNDKQRKMTKLAGELAGLKVERLINEPTSAALSYGIHEKEDVQILVIDLGGGTFDVSVLELFDGIIEVRSSAGDTNLGGEDFTKVLIDHFLSRNTINDDVKERNKHRLIAAAERAKVALSQGSDTSMKVEIEDKHYEIEVTQAEFEAQSSPLLKRLQDPVRQALRDCNIRPDQLQAVLLVGGATRMPMISKLVTKMFGRFPDKSLHPDHVVALGAAVQGALKSRNKALKEVILTDVCPYTLGLEVVTQLQNGQFKNGVFHPIIERNTTIPVSREDSFYTVYDNQDKLNIRVYQGESRQTQDNILLGNIEVPVEQAPSGERSVIVRFSYDSNGLLEIDAKVEGEQKGHQLIIADDTHQLTEDEISASIDKLKAFKIHPRDENENIALLYRGNRLYMQHQGERREAIGQMIDEFSHLLESQDKQKIKVARKEVAKHFDQFEL